MVYQMHQTMRWYGPHDTVPLSHIRQAGCAGVVTALHHIPVGAVWPVDEINSRKAEIEAAGMTWTVIESLPVSEDIKSMSGAYLQHIEHYKQSLRNVAACGLKVVTYNFMPVLDWLRTNVHYELQNGSRALYFERIAFVAFDLYLLRRQDAEHDYSQQEKIEAARYFAKLKEKEKQDLFNTLMLGLPGSTVDFTPEEVREALEKYKDTDAGKLQQNLFNFLKAIIPVAEEAGVVMAIHPDDPPYPVLGLPRIMSTEQHAGDLLEAIPSPANGLCFCTGSFGARPDNNLVNMIKKFGDRIHFLHLRNTKRDDAGNFYEAAHLEGDSDMHAIIKEIVDLQQRRKTALPMRPDHGHQMLDDLDKSAYPGYSAIGRLKGLAELRGVEYALLREMGNDTAKP